MIDANGRSSEEIARLSNAIEIATQAAVRQALIEHKRAGDPIVVCDEDGNVRWVPAEEIVIPDEPVTPERGDGPASP